MTIPSMTIPSMITPSMTITSILLNHEDIQLYDTQKMTLRTSITSITKLSIQAELKDTRQPLF